MAQTFKTPSQIADDYLTHLKGLKPDVNISQQDSDWWIKSRVIGGVVAGAYADQRLIANDGFPQKARYDAVGRYLNTYFNRDYNAGVAASGLALLSGVSGSPASPGLQLKYGPNGNLYQTSDSVILDGGTGGNTATGLVPVVSLGIGQIQNLLDGALLTIAAAPSGINPTAVVSGGLRDGKDAESREEAIAKILARIRNPISGGTETDYDQWALEADPSVTSSRVFRYIRGLGTVGVSITAGTTDIDTAINTGQVISRIPSQSLLDAVAAYLETKKPLTDCVTVFSPSEVPQDVTVNVKYAVGYSGTFVPGGQVLTLNQLVAREIKRALYKIPIGGRTLGVSGYVVASEIEEAIDVSLSAQAFVQGTLAQAIADRQCQNLALTGINRLLAINELVIPGTINVVEL